MKFLVALLSVVSATATLPIYGSKVQLHDVKADSKMGATLLSKARKLEENGDADFTWIADYSIKFQGCHHVSQWNDEADDENDVKIVTKRLVRFRLCPSNSCSATDAGGCSSGYGDYVIDMNTYLQAYTEAVEEYNEYRCKNLEENVCACEDDGSDDFDEEKCMYDCYVNNGVESICADQNPYEEDDGQEEEAFELKDYMECGRWENKNRRRKLDDAQVEYFIGPYCAEQGGAIFLGLFTDDACTVHADEYGGVQTYYSLAGKDMPYGSQSVVGMDCVLCKEPEENNGENDQADEDQVIEMCEEIYQMAGKCESSLGISNPNTNACTYMQGIKIIRQNGVVTSKSGSTNKTASVFIGIFVVSFLLLAAYVYYLRTKLDRASINLSE